MPPGPDAVPGAPGIRCRLLPVPLAAQFAATKLSPGRNNVRAHTGEGQQLPTPGYNAALLQV